MVETTLIARILARDEATRSLQRVQSSIIRLVGAVASLNAAFKVLAFPIKQAIEFETALSDVQKTTGFTDSSIEALSVSLRKLATETGVAAADLAKIAAAAGQLGLGREGRAAIIAFTDTVSRFATTADLEVDAAAVSIAKITNLFQIPITQAEKVSAAFNELSNTTVATAEQLVDIVRRIGTAGGLLKFEGAVALAATSLELGQTVEVAGTAVVKAFANMQVNASKFANTVQVTTDEWVTELETDGLGALKDVATAISKLEGVAKGRAIKELFGGGRQFAFASRLVEDAANGFKILNRTLEDSVRAFAEGTSAQREFDQIQRRTERQLALTREAFIDLAIAAGQRFLPAIKQALQALREFALREGTLDRIEALAENLLTASQAFLSFGSAIGSILPDLETMAVLLGAFIAILIGKGLVAGVIGLGRAFQVWGGHLALVNTAIPLLGAQLLTWITISGSFAASVAAAGAALHAFALSAFAAIGVLTPILLTVAAFATAIIVLFPQVQHAILEFIFGVEEAAEKTSTSMRAINREIKSNIAAFEEAVTANRGKGIRAFDLDTDNAEELIRLTKLQVGVIGALSQALAGAEAKSDLVNKSAIELVDKYSAAQVELVQLQGNLDGLQETQDKIVGAGPAFLVSDIEQASNAVREQVGLVNALKTALDLSVDSFKEISGQAITMSAELEKAKESINGLLTATQQQAILTEIQLTRQNAKLVEQRKLRDDLTAQLFADDPVASSTEINEKLGEVNAAMQETALSIEQLSKESKILAPALAAAVPQQVLAGFNELEDAAQDTFIIAIGKGNENLSRMVVETSNVIDTVKQLVATQIQLKRESAVFEVLRKAANRTAKSVTGIFDNLPNLINAGRQSLGLFLREIGRIPAQREIELKFRVDEAVIDKQLEKDLERIQDKFERLSDRADPGTGRGRRRIRQLERERDRSIEVTESLAQTAKVQNELNLLQTGFEQAKERSGDLDKEATELIKEITRLKENESALGAEGAKQQTIALQKLKLINSEQADIRKEVQDTALEYSKFAGQVDELTAAGGVGFISIDSTGIEAAGASAKTVVEASLQSTAQLVAAGGEAANTLQSTIVGLDSAKAHLADIEANLNQIKTLWGLNVKQINEVRDALEAQLDPTGFIASIEQTTRAAAGALDIGAVKFVTKETGQKIAEEIGEIALSAVISDETLESIRKTLEIAGPQTTVLFKAEVAEVEVLEEARTIPVTAEVNEITTAPDVPPHVIPTKAEIVEVTTAPSVPEEVFPPQTITIQGVDVLADENLAENIQRVLSGQEPIVTIKGIEVPPDPFARDVLPEVPVDLDVDSTPLDALEADPLIITAKIVTEDGSPLFGDKPFNVAGAAKGGEVFGPGTGTSDSILARLSRGEYVIDAFTTSRFGAAFFAQLQQLARTRYPTFAAGGLVGATIPQSPIPPTTEGRSALAGSEGNVTLNLNFNDTPIELQGTRENVNEFTRQMRELSRGLIR